jgi:hypothetical protein
VPKFRNVSGVPRRVGYGCPVQTVQPDEVLHVISEAAISYANQPTIWAPVDKAAQDAEDEFQAALAFFADPPPAAKATTKTKPDVEPVADKETTE